MKTSIILIALALLAGCSAFVPKEKTSVSTVATAEKIAAQNSVAIQRVVQGAPPQPLPSVTVSGTSNRVDIAYAPPVHTAAKLLPPYQDATSFTATTGQDSSTKLDDNTTSSVTIPLGAKLAMLAVGLAMLGGVVFLGVRALKRSSLAAASAFELADSGMAKGIKLAHEGFGAAIRGVRDRASLSTDPKEIALLASLTASLESDRGKTAAGLEAERGKVAGAS